MLTASYFNDVFKPKQEFVVICIKAIEITQTVNTESGMKISARFCSPLKTK